MKALIKHGHVGVAGAAIVMAVNAILFHGNDEATSAMTALALVVCFGVFHFLNMRDDRTNGSCDEDAN
jgi:hypothetical protein